MLGELESLLGRYDRGEVSRREMLGALMLLAIPSAASAATEPVVGAARQLNHVTLYVSDVAKSRTFYQDLFGMPVLTQQDPGVNLRIGSGFLGIYPADAGVKPRIDHVCLGIARFDAVTVKRQLATRGIDATIRERGETKELYFEDPDGIRVQVQHERYRGGVGPLGDRDPSPKRAGA